MQPGISIVDRVRYTSWGVRSIYGVLLLISGLSIDTLVQAVMIRWQRKTWFISPSNIDPLYELGTSLGFWGMLFFCVNCVLATRWLWVERLFGGLDVVYRMHAFVGKSTFIMLVLHLMVLIVQALADTDTLVAYLIPGLDLSYTLGMMGLFGLVALVVVTLWGSMPYQLWLTSHAWLGVPYLLGGAHALVAQADWYIALLTAIGGLAWIYSIALYRRYAPHARGQIAALTTQHGITELRIALDTPLAAVAGQFVFFAVTKSQTAIPAELHPFSLSAIESPRDVRLSIKMLGDYTRQLDQLAPGDAVTLYGPYGMFGRRMPTTQRQLWIAGGIGITPFLSLLQQASHDTEITLVWAVRTRADARYIDELTQHATERTGISVHLHEGPLSLADIEAYAGPLCTQTQQVLMCAPIPLMRLMRAALLARGYAAHQIDSEEFGLR
ncbi:MAG: ferric reductase-like transmembrane domain-containing protein [Roseiflexaceae bacterium]